MNKEQRSKLTLSTNLNSNNTNATQLSVNTKTLTWFESLPQCECVWMDVYQLLIFFESAFYISLHCTYINLIILWSIMRVCGVCHIYVCEYFNFYMCMHICDCTIKIFLFCVSCVCMCVICIFSYSLYLYVCRCLIIKRRT